MRDLLASQRGWAAFEAAEDIVDARDLAIAEAKRHAGASTTEQATDSDGLLDDFLSTLLSRGAETVGYCSTSHMVRPQGLEP